MCIRDSSASIYPRSGTTMEWDTAAGQAIIEAAGGKLLNVADSSPVTYNRPDLRNPDFVAVSIPSRHPFSLPQLQLSPPCSRK